MMSRLATMLLLASAAGCVPDPKKGCDDGCERDAGEQDTGQDAQSAHDADAGAQPRLDADTGSVDAARDMDTGMRDARSPRDAMRPDTGRPGVLPLEGDLGVHDPTIIEADGVFTIFSTGKGLPVKRSTDLLFWEDSGRVFAKNPAWVAQEVPGATDLWAPDIAYYAGKYHLYYSASTFGSRNSCIGHATSTDLSSFVDQGPVICTEQSDDYNAIDPAFVLDDGGTPWLSFGSFWSGIKLIQLDADGQRLGTELHALASREEEAIEAPYIVSHDGFYYLFVSFDRCCRGADSTYRIMVGRSVNITGPYVDAEGTPMLTAGGGTMVVAGNQRWRGPGHNAVLSVGNEQYLVYHSYDADRGGAPTLRIADLLWSGGWPAAVGP